MSDKLKVNQVYNFDIFPSEIMGNNFKNVTVIGLINSTIAQTFLDIEATHVQVYPYLPTGTPNDPRSYDYVMVRTQAGENTVLGLPWINSDSIILVEAGTIFVDIPNVTSEDIVRVSDALTANGFHGFNIKMR